ncbi:sugar phosphate isomerase/epimerase [Pendulispora rubella]|uniref:Sugar phosphate isomerase/epimerase n=1 Tax=Pendulispora rubella TaxID=2741070 RepID=A0ABZ2LHW2_9BACT
MMARLSLNQWTTRHWTMDEAIEGCVREGIPAIGIWREHVQAYGLSTTVRHLREARLRVSSLCRGGFFTASDPAARREALADNRRAIDEAAQLGAPCLALVVGGLPAGDRDLPGARRRVIDALAELAPYAAAAGIRLALEPLHPMYCAERAVVSTLAQALGIAESFPVEHVGVIVDTFHVWWDPDVFTQIARAGARIASFQVSDWLVPVPQDLLLARGLMGDGIIDFPPLCRALIAAGYDGDIEVEIFNADLWSRPGHEIATAVVQRYIEHIGPWFKVTMREAPRP